MSNNTKTTVQTTLPPRPVVLCILDGWGLSEDTANNAIAQANTPNYDRMMTNGPHATLQTSGLAVGLPEGQMGNSEVGHMNLGGGRVVMQDLPRIDAAIADGTLQTNPALLQLVVKLRTSGGTCHLAGLLSPGGVHSHQKHIATLAGVLDRAGVPVAIHAFLDGRDTPPKSALDYLGVLESDIQDMPNVHIASVSGRYYAMDRDKRWDRVMKAYDCIVDAKGNRSDTPREAVEASYKENLTDEFVLPTAIGNYKGMKDGDGLLMANFRADRAREILTALVDPQFDGFPRARQVNLVSAQGMVEYSSALAPFIGRVVPA